MGGAAGEHQPALGAADEVLEQIEYLGVALGPYRPLFLDGLRAVPGLLVHQRRERHLYPLIFRLRVDSLSGLHHDPAGLAVVPGAFVDLPAENGADVQDLADRVGVSYSYMTQVARGRQSMGVKVQARVESALKAPAKVAPAKCANRQGVVVAGESSYIRERARELGMSLRDLADRVGVSYSYMSMVARGHSNMGVKVQARMESALEAPAKVAPAQPACIDWEAVWDRMNAHGFSQNEVARRAGISSSNLSQIMNGRNNLSPDVLKRLHGVLFQPTKAERVMPAEVKVLGWRKGERSGMVVRGAGGPGRGAKAGGGHVPWGAKAEFAYRAGYDGMGRVSVTHVVERGYSAMLKQPELAAA